MIAKPMTEFNLSCPVPRVADDRIVLAHGGGGRLTHQLIEKIFMPAFGNPMLEQRHDGAVLAVNGSRLAFTTDSFVVRPLIFPGGTIGDLAVYGTVNDLAMCGARPLYLSAGFILEEGLAMDTLRTVVASMQEAAAKAGVQLVTGDTKVVDKGKGDGDLRQYLRHRPDRSEREGDDRSGVGSGWRRGDRQRRSGAAWGRDSLGTRGPGI